MMTTHTHYSLLPKTISALGLIAALSIPAAGGQAQAASYIQDPEIRWTVSVFNSPDTARRFTREPIYMLNVGADRNDVWAAPRNATTLEKGTVVLARGTDGVFANGGLFNDMVGDRVEVYVLRRSQGSSAKIALAVSGTLAYELQGYIAEGGINDYRIPNAIDTFLQRLDRDDDDTLGGFMMKIRRLSAGQISVTWSPIGESSIAGEPTTKVNNKGRSTISTRASFVVGRSIYPYQISADLWVASYRQTIGIENFVQITAPLPDSSSAPLPQPQDATNAPALPASMPFNGDSFPCSRPGLNRSNLCVLQPYPAKRGSAVSVVWRIADFRQGEFDSGDGRGYVGPINAEMRVDLPEVTAPRMVRLRWTDTSGRAHEDTFLVQVVD